VTVLCIVINQERQQFEQIAISQRLIALSGYSIGDRSMDPKTKQKATQIIIATTKKQKKNYYLHPSSSRRCNDEARRK
jgi:hypothetical protein